MEEHGEQRNGDNGQAPMADVWLRVVDLASELGVDPRAMRRWISRNLSNAAQRRVLRPDGGHPELWVSPSGAAAIKEHYSGEEAAAEAQRVVGETVGRQGIKGTDTVSDEAEGWKAAVSAAEGRANELRQELERTRGEASAEVDRLRRELTAERDVRERAERQAEEAERARAVYAERLAEERAGWWQWCAYLKGLSMFRRMRGIPEPPEDLAKGTKRLGPPRG